MSVSKASDVPAESRAEYLDGLRGAASLMVVSYHLFFGFFAYKWADHSKWYLKFTSDGQLAVFIFFVISGVALSTAYVAARDNGILTSLALRRYPRLAIPIFVSCALTFFLMVGGLLYNVEAAKFCPKGNWLNYWLMPKPVFSELLQFSLSDVYFNYEVTKSYNNVLWTMGPELAGSFLIFCTLALFGTLERRCYVYAVIGLVLFFMESRLLPFVFGMLLAELFHGKSFGAIRNRPGTKYIGLAFCLIAVAFATFDTSFHTKSNILSLVAALVILGVRMCVPLCWIFETRVLMFLGRISFPLYLTHLLVFCSFSSFLFIYMTQAGWNPHTVKNTVIVASFGASLLAACIFSPVEDFAVRISRRFARYVISAR